MKLEQKVKYLNVKISALIIALSFFVLGVVATCLYCKSNNKYFVVNVKEYIKKADKDKGKLVATSGKIKVFEEDINEKMNKLSMLLSSQGNLRFEELEPSLQEAVVKEIVVNKEIERQAYKKGFIGNDKVKSEVMDDVLKIASREYLLYKGEKMVKEEDIKARYEEIKKTLKGKVEVDASHILLKTEEQAKDIKNQATSGASFDELAKKYSLDTSTAKKGGNLGYFIEGQMVKEFDNAVFKMQKGEISDPIKTSFGWHVVKLNDKREVKVGEYSELKENLSKSLAAKNIKAYIEELVKETKVKIEPEFVAKNK